MVTADVKPTTLHLKPEHYKLLANQKMPIVSSKDELSSVVSIIVHGSCDLPPAEKEKLNNMFPNMWNYVKSIVAKGVARTEWRPPVTSGVSRWR